MSVILGCEVGILEVEQDGNSLEGLLPRACFRSFRKESDQVARNTKTQSRTTMITSS